MFCVAHVPESWEHKPATSIKTRSSSTRISSRPSLGGETVHASSSNCRRGYGKKGSPFTNGPTWRIIFSATHSRIFSISLALRATLSHPLETQISHEDDVGKRGSFVQAATYYELINQNYTRKYPFLSHPYFWYKYLSIYISYININLRLNSPWRPIVSAACFAAVGNRNLIRPLVWDNRWAARIKRYIC